MDLEALPQMVRSLRKLTKLSQHELADLAGVGKTFIFDLEKGKTNVRYDNVLKVLHALNIRVTLHSPVEREDV